MLWKVEHSRKYLEERWDRDQVDWVKIIESESEEKYTNPPNRYSSTSLINKLEELGIGRPSTYVSIIESITSVFINSESSLKPRILAIALINNFMKPYFNQYIDYEFSKTMEDELDLILESKNPEESKIKFLQKSHETIKSHVEDYGIQDPLALTTVKLPFESRYVVKTGRIQGKIPYPYLLRDDDFKVGLPPEITIEEIEEEILIDEEELSEYQQKRFGPRGDLIIQKQQLIQPIQDQIFNAIRELAKSRNYDFIFDKSADIVMLYSDKRYDVSDQILRTISRANNRKKVDSRKDKREIENESLIDETTVVSDIENKEKEDISDEKVSTPNKKLTVKELLEQRKQKNSDKRKVKD